MTECPTKCVFLFHILRQNYTKSQAVWPCRSLGHLQNLQFLEELPSHLGRYVLQYRGGTAPTCLHVAPDSLIPDAGPSPRAYLQADSSRPFVSGTDDTIGPLQKRAASFFPGVCPSVGLFNCWRRGAAMAQSDEKGQARSIWYPTRQLGCGPGYKIWEPPANSPPPSVTVRMPTL